MKFAEILIAIKKDYAKSCSCQGKDMKPWLFPVSLYLTDTTSGVDFLHDGSDQFFNLE